MTGDRQVVILVSRIGMREAGFFDDWGATSAGPNHAAYLDENGAAGDPERSRIVLVSGQQGQLAERVVAAARLTGDALAQAYLLIHPGGGMELHKVLKTKVPPRESQDQQVWEGLLARSFTWSTDAPIGSRLRHFFRAELAVHHGNKDQFPPAFGRLCRALQAALADHPGGAEKAEQRTDTAERILSAPGKRTQAAGEEERSGAADRPHEISGQHRGDGPQTRPFSPSPHPAPRRNPVAAIIHDVVNRFDPLLLDLSTATDDPEYWHEAKHHYAGQEGIATSLEHLRSVLLGSGSEAPAQWLAERGLQTVPDIMERIFRAAREDPVVQQNLDVIRGSLGARVDPGEEAWTLLARIADPDGGGIDSDPAALRDTLAAWMARLKSEFRELDKLFLEYVKKDSPEPR